METDVAEWEAIASLVLSDSRPDVRRKAEEKIQQLRIRPQPYDLCHAILTRSSNDFLLYEAGRCLSHAVVKEWDTVFAPSAHAGDHSRAKQLLTFILGWAEQRGTQVSAAPRQRVLSVAGALIKRAASSMAIQVAAEAASTTDSRTPTSARAKLDAIYRKLENPTSDALLLSCDLVMQLLDHIESLILPLIECHFDHVGPHEKQVVVHRCLLGMCTLSAVLDEWSFSDDSTQAELTLETHRLLETRFQNFELLRIFCLLLRLSDRVVHIWSDITSLSAVENDLIFRLVACLDSVFSWNFLPAGSLYLFRRRDRSSKTHFYPSVKWAIVLGPNSLPTTLLILIKLHMLVRSSSMLGTRTLSFFSRLASITGPLAEPSALYELAPNQGYETNDSPSLVNSRKPPATTTHLYFLICITYLTGWLTENASESFTTSSVLASLAPDQQERVKTELLTSLSMHVADQIPVLFINQLFVYEMSILAEVFEQIAFRMSVVWERIETALEAPVMLDHPQYTELVHLPALVTLAVIDRFFARLASVLIQCFHFASNDSFDHDDSEEPINEAIERLSCNWIHLIQFIPLYDRSANGLDESRNHEPGDNTAIPLTARGMEQQELQTHHMRQLLHLFITNVAHYRTRLFQSYLLCKIGPPDGTRPTCKENEDLIDLELDIDDLYTSENCLYACASCGLASPSLTVTTLLQLVVDRMTRMMQIHNQPDNPRLLDLYEDMHWVLLITGHFLVTGPSSLDSVSRSASWGTEFSIPLELCQGIDKDSLDHGTCLQLLQLAADRCSNPQQPWPPIDIRTSSVPTVIQLFASLHHLLWLQSEHHFGSAQLMEDNLWLMSRLALAYLCLVVRDRESLVDSKYTTPLMSVFHADYRSPAPVAHHSQSQSDLISSGQVVRICIQGLLSCACHVLNKWFVEPKVVSSAICLIRIVARHTPNASLHLSCSAWYELCSMLCNPESMGPGRDLAPDVLTELVEACLCGSWLLDKDRLYPPNINWDAASPDDPLVLKLLHNFRQRLSVVFTRLSGVSCSTVSSSDVDALVQCTATIRGLVRFCGFAVAQSSSAIDLISFAWTGLLYPALEASVSTLMKGFHNCPEVTRCVLNLFAETAESCFIYLANIPLSSAIKQQCDEQSSHSVSYQVGGTSSSTVFLNLVLKLYRDFAKQNIGQSSSEPSAEDDRINHIGSLLTILNRLAGDEFELRLAEVVSNANTVQRNSDLTGPSVGLCTIQSIDVIAVCLGQLLPLITEHLLMIPELCHLFYTALSSACELRIESLALLDDSQLVYLGRLLRLGIFGSISTVPVPSSGSFRSADSSVTLRSLEVLKMIADHCLDVRSKAAASIAVSSNVNSSKLEVAKRLSTSIGLDMPLLVDLFGLVLKDTFNTNVELPLALTILCLIHMNPDGYAQLVSQWLSSSQDPAVRNRLQSAFERLGCASEESLAHLPPNARVIDCFTDQRPTVTARTDFQRRFHQFASEVRAFACHT